MPVPRRPVRKKVKRPVQPVKKRVKKTVKKTAKKAVNKKAAALTREKRTAFEWAQKGINDLAEKLTKRELVMLRNALPNIETFQPAKVVFQEIAKRHGVSAGDLEIALTVRLGEKNLHRSVKNVPRSVREARPK